MTNNTIKLLIKNEDVGLRLDKILAKKINHLTRSNLKKLIENNRVKINDLTIISPSKKLKINDVIIINLEKKTNLKIKPSKLKLNIIYEDEDIVLVDKPAGMVVHPGAGNFENTLVNALVYKYKNKLSSINGNLRPGIVHRIDKETSGILVVAKNNLAHSNLGEQFSNHTIKRKYLALVWGVIRPLNGKIKTLITRSKKNRQLMTVSDLSGKLAVTNYFTKKIYNIENIPKISLLEFELETGRTHQIRVHMAYKKSFILGDKQYGKKNIKFKKIHKEFEKKLNQLNRQALHAVSLGFVHPKTNKFINFDSKIPIDFKKILDLLNKLSN